MSSNCQSKARERFRHRNRVANVIVFCLTTIAGVVAGAYVIVRGSTGPGIAIVALSVVWFGSFTLLVISRQGDVIIDARGISEILFGKSRKRVNWDQIVKIRVVRIFDQGRGRKTRTIVLDQTNSIRERNFATDKHSFTVSEDYEPFDRLLELLNCYIREHNIPVEIEKNSQKLQTDRIT